MIDSSGVPANNSRSDENLPPAQENRHQRRRRLITAGLIPVVCVAATLLALAPFRSSKTQSNPPYDWRSDWAVQDSFALSIDADGFDFPTSIAFVPHPGAEPKAPLYFVAELGGAIKVVTNDRSVYTFADKFMHRAPHVELPDGQGQTGMAGICLDPERGYVFGTFAYLDDEGILRNNIIRFESTPRTFSLKPKAQRMFTEIFGGQETGLAHQIGNCEVDGNALFVGVGEGWQPLLTQQLDHLHGKLLRMSLDGEPLPDNPFYEDSDASNVRNFVWAYGLRNPFALRIVDDQVFVADNGAGIDRFLKIRRGLNYLWNGTDASITANAAYVWHPSIGPVQMDYSDGVSPLSGAYQNTFFIAFSGEMQYQKKKPGIAMVRYGMNKDAVLEVPTHLIDYRGNAYQVIAGLALGPDGLYFSPLIPNAAGKSPILKIRRDPANAFPYQIGMNMTAEDLIVEKGCRGCHTIDGRWGYGGGAAGPPLVRGKELVNRLKLELGSQAYAEQLDGLDTVETKPQVSYEAARQEVLDAEGVEKVRTWLKYYLQEPQFDRRQNRMPNLGLTKREAVTVADYLMKGKGDRAVSATQIFRTRVRQALARILPTWIGPKNSVFFVAGVILGGGLWWLAGLFASRRRRWFRGSARRSATNPI